MYILLFSCLSKYLNNSFRSQSNVQEPLEIIIKHIPSVFFSKFHCTRLIEPRFRAFLRALLDLYSHRACTKRDRSVNMSPYDCTSSDSLST